MQAAACTGYSARPSSKETVLTINVSQCRQWSHLREQADRIGMRLVATQFAIDHCYVDDDTFAVRPRGIAIQWYILCRLECRHTRLVTFARLVIDVFEVTLDLGHALFISDRAMAGNDGFHVHLQDAVAGPQPVTHRPGPHNGVTADEDDIAREDNTVVRDMLLRSTKEVRRANLKEMDRLTPLL